MSNYTVYHCHSDLSNGTTNIDSVTKYQDYITAAKNCGMTAFGFAEHGNIFEWWHKKSAVEAAGMKYIHAVEAYITETLDKKIRDNYHCVLIARNYEGFRELNKLVSASFGRGDDNHFYYVPRVSIDELVTASSNILVATACLGGILNNGTDGIKGRFLEFLLANKERCFLEIQHHMDLEQVEYNRYLYNLSKQYGLRLIAGTDTHALNQTHIEGRGALQRAKKVRFDNEDSWDLTFKTYEELLGAYRRQKALPEAAVLEALENTNLMASMVDEFQIDRSPKYPKLYDRPLEAFVEKVQRAAESHPCIWRRYTQEQIQKVVGEEIAVYEKTQSIDFMLLQTYLREWERENGIVCGPGRGSVSGSMVAYILGITQMDSLRFDLNFFRFQSPDRISNCDIDTDYSGADRDRVKRFILRDKMNMPKIRSAEIITFNTIALKGAIRDIARALEIDKDTVSEICSAADNENALSAFREKYRELFRLVDIVQGTVVSIGTHPSGVLISDLDIAQEIGLCTTSTSDYPISMLNMKELDDLFYVKLDILGLDGVGLINETCRLAGINILTPDNTDLEDETVWNSIRDDTTMIFQWESGQAQAYLRRFMSEETIRRAKEVNPNFNMLKWLSFGNGLLRPACASYRDEVADGVFYDNRFDALNRFLANEMGHVCMQETIMKWLVEFCGYSNAESDQIRRKIGKKQNTEELLPEIERRFIEYAPMRYDISIEEAARVIKPFLQVIMDASSYAFSWNHSDAYSCIGYICGYLRHYHPLEFITAALNIFQDDEEKTASIVAYAQKNRVEVLPPRFGHSRAGYFIDHENGAIYKGVKSIKYLNEAVAEELYELSKGKSSEGCFVDLLTRITNETSLDARQLDILVSLDFFSEYGYSTTLHQICDLFNWLKGGQAKKMAKEAVGKSKFADLFPIYATDKGKNKNELKAYVITDMGGLLRACEERVRGKACPDAPFKAKAATQLEFLGYVDLTTKNPADRKKLLITDVISLKDKKTGKPWAYRIISRSIGTGKSAALSVKADIYRQNPIKKMDIVEAESLSKNKAGYWYMYSYDIIG